MTVLGHLTCNACGTVAFFKHPKPGEVKHTGWKKYKDNVICPDCLKRVSK